MARSLASSYRYYQPYPKRILARLVYALMNRTLYLTIYDHIDNMNTIIDIFLSYLGCITKGTLVEVAEELTHFSETQFKAMTTENSRRPKVPFSKILP